MQDLNPVEYIVFQVKFFLLNSLLEVIGFTSAFLMNANIWVAYFCDCHCFFVQKLLDFLCSTDSTVTCTTDLTANLQILDRIF